MKLDLALSALVACLFGVRLIGLAVVNPANIRWLSGDAATYYIGWAIFRQTGPVQWPLTVTPSLGYPIGESISLLDPIPIAAVLLAPLSKLLPQTFQYLGLYSILSIGLQFFFAARLLRKLSSQRSIAIWLGASLFVLAPPLLFRMGGHFALASHWLIVAALLLYTMVQQGMTAMQFGWRSALLTIAAVGVNPYIAFMVLAVLLAACLSAALKRSMRLTAIAGTAAVIICSAAVASSAFGLSGGSGKDYSGKGYRHFSMNLLAPIDPAQGGSILLGPKGQYTTGQYEGFNYLGLGVLGLLAVTLPWNLRRLLRVTKAGLYAWTPLIVCSLVLAAMAVSTYVTAGSQLLVDLDPSDRLTPYLSALRASGRLFWMPFYALVLYAVTSVYRIPSPRVAMALLAVAVGVQYADTRQLRGNVRTALSVSPPFQLTSAAWHSLREKHRNLIVLPPWQCGTETPGGADGFRVFGLLAAQQGLAINSYYAARYRADTLEFHCKKAIEDVATQGLQPETAYVVTPHIAALIEKSRSGPGHCYDVDGFALCTLTPMSTETPLQPGVVPELSFGTKPMSSKDAAHLASGWTGVEPGFGSWSTGDATLVYRNGVKGAGSLKLTLIGLSGPRPIHFEIVHDSGRFEGVLPAGSPEIRLFSIRLPLSNSMSEQQTLRFRTKDVVSPADQKINADPRKLGIGIHTIGLDSCPPSNIINPPSNGC